MRGARPHGGLEQYVAQRLALQAGEVVLAAVSGGADSVALAALLQRCAAEAQATLVLGHVNHRVRPSSWQDEAVVLSVGAALGVRVLTRSLGEGSAAEARLRAERYVALADMAREVGAVRVATAHHAQDQTETVLLALFRGTGPGGLRGMPARRPLAEGIRLERPLLRTRPHDLVAYCLARGLPCAVDASNADVHYGRNAVRAALVGLRERFPHLDEAVARCAEIAAEDAAQSERAHMRRRLRDELGHAGELTDVTFERLDAAVQGLQSGRHGRHFIKRGIHFEVRGR
ncbi:MAG TPA: tRNA lysidine(34) synthetase TilS [Candidatus Acidoferrales bacterium]|nr:tRNA lysidine(34) synthetase TilS [Candidatus Acidoferrales bacterium]